METKQLPMNKTCVKKEIKKEIKDIELNKNYNTDSSNLWNKIKTVLLSQFPEINSYKQNEQRKP